ncbi:unnamed protein product [Owenia fusiformis]|uniref:Uncharacterized protein n=1 Tax=Owenia fusiformis TaxID=6347 RepID=A0A8J1XI98_OWEFU|nr:unnamed protein product [Owenia fusiformis]
MEFDFGSKHAMLTAPNDFPVFVKSAMGTTSCLVGIASDEKSLGNYMNLIKDDIKVVLQPFRGLIKKFLNLDLYPQALSGIVMLEQYVDIGKTPVTIHTIDGIVGHGKIVPWAISDNIYFKHRPQCFQGVGIPSVLAEETQNNMWRVYVALVENLQKYGFDNEFVDAEVFVFSDGTIKLMEMNGRGFPLMFKLYDEVLNKGDIIEAHLNISRGVIPETPTNKPDRYGLYAYMATFGSGKVADFIDLDKLSEYSDIATFGHEADTVVEPKGESGFNLGFLSIVDSSYQACVDKMEVLKVNLLKHPEYSPWWNN